MPMATNLQKVIEALAEELNIPEESVVPQGLKTLVEKNLRQVKAEIFRLHGQYGVSSAEEMEERYRQGTMEERSTWRDFQRLDHLEHTKNRLEKLLRELGWSGLTCAPW
jgi:hypothetical protein